MINEVDMIVDERTISINTALIRQLSLIVSSLTTHTHDHLQT
jgi:hypothetical protein